jgi:hypothetical protein
MDLAAAVGCQYDRSVVAINQSNSAVDVIDPLMLLSIDLSAAAAVVDAIDLLLLLLSIDLSVLLLLSRINTLPYS